MNIEALKKAAQAATPGPWRFAICDHRNYTLSGAVITGAGDEANGYPVVADLPPRTMRGTHEANAAHIAAANPAAVLALIASHDQLVVALSRLLPSIPISKGSLGYEADAAARAALAAACNKS